MRRFIRGCAILAMAVFGSGLLTGCETVQIVAGTATVTGVGSILPSNEMEQIYYLGVFDPHEQVPPTIYRVRVRGQASSFSRMKFASGWVKAELIDTLGSKIAFNNEKDSLEINPGEKDILGELETGRRLMLFGPEGFREAPKDHRLVIVMGASPEDFFSAIDDSLGVISKVQSEQRDSELNRLLFEALIHAENERTNLARLKTDIDSALAESKEETP